MPGMASRGEGRTPLAPIIYPVKSAAHAPPPASARPGSPTGSSGKGHTFGGGGDRLGGRSPCKHLLWDREGL